MSSVQDGPSWLIFICPWISGHTPVDPPSILQFRRPTTGTCPDFSYAFAADDSYCVLSDFRTWGTLNHSNFLLRRFLYWRFLWFARAWANGVDLILFSWSYGDCGCCWGGQKWWGYVSGSAGLIRVRNTSYKRRLMNLPISNKVAIHKLQRSILSSQVKLKY